MELKDFIDFADREWGCKIYVDVKQKPETFEDIFGFTNNPKRRDYMEKTMAELQEECGTCKFYKTYYEGVSDCMCYNSHSDKFCEFPNRHYLCERYKEVEHRREG